MQTNRITGGVAVGAPADQAERVRHWIERGNRILWGQEPCADGSYLAPRHDLEWRCVNGHYFIESRA